MDREAMIDEAEMPSEHGCGNGSYTEFVH